MSLGTFLHGKNAKKNDCTVKTISLGFRDLGWGFRRFPSLVPRIESLALAVRQHLQP